MTSMKSIHIMFVIVREDKNTLPWITEQAVPWGNRIPYGANVRTSLDAVEHQSTKPSSTRNWIGADVRQNDPWEMLTSTPYQSSILQLKMHRNHDISKQTLKKICPP